LSPAAAAAGRDATARAALAIASAAIKVENRIAVLPVFQRHRFGDLPVPYSEMPEHGSVI
jgi:hypothetical protein